MDPDLVKSKPLQERAACCVFRKYTAHELVQTPVGSDFDQGGEHCPAGAVTVATRVRRTFERLAQPPDPLPRNSGRARPNAMSWATMKPGASLGRMPAKVSLNDRAIVTAGFANDVDAVNQ